MTTQKLHLDTSETGVMEHRRSRKLGPLIAGAAVLVILAAIGVYYVAFRSLPTTVSWAPSVSAIAPGGELTVSGRVTPAESGRLVSFESASSAQGPWLPMPQSATTDSRGRFSITYKPQLTGSIVMRVVVDPAGRYLAVTGQSNAVRLLTPSSISLKGGGVKAARAPINFSVAVDPPVAGRTVRIQRSSDKVRWVTVGPAARTKANGSSVVKVPGPAVGVWSYRARVAQDGKFAAAVSPIVSVTVEDIKAAAATYISIINRSNAALDAYKKVAKTTYDSSVPASWRKAAGTFSAVETKTAAQLRAYGAWPHSVKPLVDQMIAQVVISADSLHQMSAATNWEKWTPEMAKWDVAGTEAARVSTLIRQALGLPQRAID